MWVGKSETRPARLTKPRHSKFEYNMCKNTTIIIIPPRCAYLARVPVPKVGPELRRLHGEEQGRLQHHQVLLVLLWSLYIVFVGGVVRLGFWNWGVGRWAGACGRVHLHKQRHKHTCIQTHREPPPDGGEPPDHQQGQGAVLRRDCRPFHFWFFFVGEGESGGCEEGGRHSRKLYDDAPRPTIWTVYLL